jgi:hypothetical protein
MDTLPVQATQKNSPFFHTDLKLKAGSQLEFSSNSQFMMNSALMKALRGLGGLGKLAQLQAEVHLKSQTAVRALSFFELDPSQLKESVTQGQFQVGAKQAVKNGVLTPIGEVNLAGQFTSRLPKFTLDGKLKIQDEEALHFKNYAEVKEKGIQLSSTFDYRTGKYLAKILPEGQIKKFGNWSGKTQLEMKTENPESESSSLKKVGQLQVSTTTRWTQDQPGLGFSNTPQLIFDQPIVLEQSLDLNQGVTQVQLKGTVPSIQIQDFGKIDGTELNFSLHSPDTQFKEKVEVQLNLAQGQIHLDPKWAAPLGKKEPLHGLQVSLKAMAPFENRFVLNQFVADFNHSMVRLEAEATGNTLTKNSQSKGALRLNIPKNYPSWNGQSFSGKVEFPWILSISKGQNMHFEGNMTLDNVNWSKPLLQVVGIQGKIPVSEDLILQNPGMKFAYLITQNPFERVDYERLQPMIHETEQLKIGQIHVEEKVLGPFQGYFSVQQNRLSAHKFDFNLGSGKSHGEIYFDVLPVNMQFGILSRLTGIQLDEVVPESILKGHTSDHQALSGRTGLVFNLTQGTMDGRMDITEIGQRQLLTMINILDPNYVNEQMNRARFALGIAYPSRVEMAFQKGYLDMNVQMKGLISQRIDVHGIPVNAWVSGAASEIAKKGREVPLQ